MSSLLSHGHDVYFKQKELNVAKNFQTQCWSYGIYDNEANNYRYLFTCKNDDVAKRQFVAYAVGSNDLFNETLELHRIDRIGSDIGDVEEDFLVIVKYKDVDKSVQQHREKTKKMVNNDIHN